MAGCSTTLRAVPTLQDVGRQQAGMLHLNKLLMLLLLQDYDIAGSGDDWDALQACCQDAQKNVSSGLQTYCALPYATSEAVCQSDTLVGQTTSGTLE